MRAYKMVKRVAGQEKFCVDCKIKVSFYAKRCKKHAWIERPQHYKGNKSPYWKGNDATYKQIHSYINKKWGKANKCEIINCRETSNFFEWANLSGKYKRDRKDWVMACHSCNQRMDYIRRNGDKCRKGHKYTEENIYWTKNGSRKCRICARNEGMEWRKKNLK